jgi:hypothetical protein
MQSTFTTSKEDATPMLSPSPRCQQEANRSMGMTARAIAVATSASCRNATDWAVAESIQLGIALSQAATAWRGGVRHPGQDEFAGLD